MTDRDLDLRLLTACAVAREAGKLALDYFAGARSSRSSSRACRTW